MKKGRCFNLFNTLRFLCYNVAKKGGVVLTINDLEKSLDKATNDFVEELREEFEQGDLAPATKHDLCLLAQTTHSALDSFKKSILAYLKTNL